MCVFFHSFQTWKWSQKSIFLVKLKTRLLHTFESSLKISIFYSSHFPSCLRRNKESTAFKYKLWAKCLTWLNLPPSPLNFSADSVTEIRFSGKGNQPKKTIRSSIFCQIVYVGIWRFFKVRKSFSIILLVSETQLLSIHTSSATIYFAY